MNVPALFTALHLAVQQRAYLTQLVILDQSRSVLKARLYLSPGLFVQVYRNDRFDATNLVLVYGGRRLYARDQPTDRIPVPSYRLTRPTCPCRQ
jgi:hypothetical protein